MQLIKSKKGVSLPLVTGLVVLLMISSAAINEVIIRTIRSVQRIEASNRAYMAAEAGLEDALYELTPHLAGYNTPPLGDAHVRNAYFGEADWVNEWEIESKSHSNQWFGQFYPGQKLIIYLFYDGNDPGGNINTNAINDSAFNANDIITLKNVFTNFSVTFGIPDGQNFIQNVLINKIPAPHWVIDNDEDYIINEDPVDPAPYIAVGYNICDYINEDCDDDGRVNEDSPEDPVILWKLTDGASHVLIPKAGCIIDGVGSEICEKDFQLGNIVPAVMDARDPNNYVVLTFDESLEGIDENGNPVNIGTFIDATPNNSQLQFEFITVAPFEHSYIDVGIKKRIIPYLDYMVDSPNSNEIPYPEFTIKSDGYFRGFKQSVITKVRPKTTVPLFDFTIIQQQ